MPKSYEDEIRDLLKGMDRFPGETPARPSRPPRRPLALPPQMRINGQTLMGGALIMMLVAWVMRGPWSTGYPLLIYTAGYISLASVILFVVALVSLMRGGMAGGMRFGAGQEQRWRGQVIEMPRRNDPLNGVRRWWRRLTARGGRGGRGGRSGERFQW